MPGAYASKVSPVAPSFSYAPPARPGSIEATASVPGLNNYMVGSADSIARRLQQRGMRDMMQDPRMQQYLATRPFEVPVVMGTGRTSADLASDARASALYDANLEAWKAGATEQAKLAAPYALAGADPAEEQRQRNALELARRKLDTTKAGYETTAAGYAPGLAATDAQTKAMELYRNDINLRAGLDRMRELGYLPTAEQLAALTMVDRNATVDARRAGATPGYETTSWYAKQEAAKRAAAAADLAKAQADAEKSRMAAQEVDLDAAGVPITKTTADGVIYERRGGKYVRVGTKFDTWGGLMGSAGGSGAATGGNPSGATSEPKPYPASTATAPAWFKPAK